MIRENEPQRVWLDVTMSEPDSSSELLESGAASRRWQQLAVWGLAGVAALVVLIGVVNHNDPQGRPAVRTLPVPPDPHPTSVSRCKGDGCELPDAPSRPIRFAFARHLPGSIVVSEHTVNGRIGRRHPVVRQRIVHAVSGNVEITVRVAQSDGSVIPQRPATTRIAHDGYVIDFSFAGFYPPPRAQLRELADDHRIISVQS